MRTDFLRRIKSRGPVIVEVTAPIIPVLGYIVRVSRQCEADGPSHAVIGHETREHTRVPIVACGRDVWPLNWTLNPKAPTILCPACNTAIYGPLIPE